MHSRAILLFSSACMKARNNMSFKVSTKAIETTKMVVLQICNFRFLKNINHTNRKKNRKSIIGYFNWRNKAHSYMNTTSMAMQTFGTSFGIYTENCVIASIFVRSIVVVVSTWTVCETAANNSSHLHSMISILHPYLSSSSQILPNAIPFPHFCPTQFYTAHKANSDPLIHAQRLYTICTYIVYVIRIVHIRTDKARIFLIVCNI